MERFEHIPHTSDVAIRVRGRDFPELFENAAFGMFSIIADLEGLIGDVTIEIKLKAASPEELLVAWLDELLYEFFTKGIIFNSFDIIEIAADRLAARVSGRHVGDNRNRLQKEIKSATFHDLNIKNKDGGLSVDIVFDV